MASDLNIGIRHVLPLYPFIFVAMGWAATMAWERWRRGTGVVLLIVMSALAVESLGAFPNFIPFFNAAAGGSTGGFHLLGDSNLDWGQDLPLLSDWQHAHPRTPLYLSYFGLADPSYYGIRYTNLPGGYPYGPRGEFPDQPGIL